MIIINNNTKSKLILTHVEPLSYDILQEVVLDWSCSPMCRNNLLAYMYSVQSKLMLGIIHSSIVVTIIIIVYLSVYNYCQETVL